MSDHRDTVRQLTTDDLRRMDGQDGLVLQGCGGDPREWVAGINDLLTEAGILKDGSTWEIGRVGCFQHDGLTNLLFPFDAVKLEIGKLAMWRLQTHAQFGGTWLSDYVPNRLGGFVQDRSSRKPKMDLIGHDGNIYAIMGRASGLLKDAGMKEQSDEMIRRVTSSGSYDEALHIISEYVETELSHVAERRKKKQKKEKNAHER